MKRFPRGVALFTLVWALALFSPATREISRSVPLLLQTQTYWQVPPSLPDDDPITIEWNLEEAALPTASNIKTLHQMDTLATRYPTQLWIPAMRLLQTVKVADVIEPTTGKPQKNKKQPLDAHKLEQAAQIAAQAARRDPDNSFWPWMEASLRFSLGQKERGVAAMERAGKAPHFDDYLQSTLQARLELWKKHDTPTWEQRIGLWASVLYPQIQTMQQASGAAATEAANARGEGDNLRAIKIDAALLHANQILRRDSVPLIGSLVAEANGFQVLDELFNARTTRAISNVDERVKLGGDLRKQWREFVRSNGRNDIGSSADWLVEPSVAHVQNFYFDNWPWRAFGLPQSKGQFAVLSPLLLFSLAMLCAFLGSAWTIGVLASLRLNNGKTPSRGQVATCANFGFWSLLGAGVVAYRSDSLLNIFQPFWFSSENQTPLPFLLISGFALACWLFPVAFLGWKGSRRFKWVRPQREACALPRNFGRIRVAVWLLFGIFCGFVATNDVGTWDGTPFQLPISATVATLCFLGIIALEIVRIRRSGRGTLRLRLEGETPPRSTVPFPWKLARLGAWLVAIICAVFSLVNVDVGSGALVDAEFYYFPLCILATGVALIINRKVKPGDGFAFRLATRTAGVLALAWSVVFLLASLAAWPLRAELNRQLDRRLSMREVDWMKEQIAKFPPENSGR